MLFYLLCDGDDAFCVYVDDATIAIAMRMMVMLLMVGLAPGEPDRWCGERANIDWVLVDGMIALAAMGNDSANPFSKSDGNRQPHTTWAKA